MKSVLSVLSVRAAIRQAKFSVVLMQSCNPTWGGGENMRQFGAHGLLTLQIFFMFGGGSGLDIAAFELEDFLKSRIDVPHPCQLKLFFENIYSFGLGSKMELNAEK